MTRKTIDVSSFVLFLLFLPWTLSGQEKDLYDFDFVRAAEPWLSSKNHAGLGLLDRSRIARAEARFTKSDGSLADIWESRDSWQAEACTESNVRISDKIACYGKLSYIRYMGKDMGGHILMDPEYNPVNFLESTDTTRGTKSKELYSLSGGMSYSAGKKWYIGAGVDYRAGNYAKLKDPRFQNTWMDLDASAGVRFTPSGRFSAGMSLGYRKTTESVYGSIYGTTDKMYYIFTDYGGSFGFREQFDGDNGMISTSSERAMFNSFYSASLQLDCRTGNGLRFFNELSFYRRSGYYGNRGSGNIVFTEHSGFSVSLESTMLCTSDRLLHMLKAGGDWSSLDNFRNIYSQSTRPGENTETLYYGKTKTLDRTDFSAHISYKVYPASDGDLPGWSAGASFSAEGRYFISVYYPYYRSQSVMAFELSTFIEKNISIRKNILSLGAEAGYMQGTGIPASDGEYAQGSSVKIWTDIFWLNRDSEARTAARARGKLSVRYTWRLKKQTGLYAMLSDSFCHMLTNAEYLESGFRNIACVTVGCIF